MSDALLNTPAYTILRDAVLATLEAGKIRAQQAVEQEKIRTGWEIRKMLHQHPNGKRILVDLAFIRFHRSHYGHQDVE